MIAAAKNLALEAAQRPIDVHVDTGGGPSGYLGPAAILVGVILAYVFATKNVRRELAAAGKRQVRELRHDREMQVIAEKRAVLDDATEVLISAIDALSGFASNLLATELTRRKMEAAPEGSEHREAYANKWHKMISDTTAEMTTTVARINALHPALLRLRLRLPENDPIYVQYRAAVTAIDAAYDTEREKEVTDLRSDEELKAADKARSLLPHRLNQWVQSVRAWNDSLAGPE